MELVKEDIFLLWTHIGLKTIMHVSLYAIITWMVVINVLLLFDVLIPWHHLLSSITNYTETSLLFRNKDKDYLNWNLAPLGLDLSLFHFVGHSLGALLEGFGGSSPWS